MNTLCSISVALCLLLLVQVHALVDYPVTVYPLLNYTKNTSNIFNIGIIGTYNSNSAIGVIRYMIETINQDPTILPNVLLQLYRAELQDSKAQALLASQTLIDTYNVRAFVGGLYSDETEMTQLVASIYDIPHICATPTSPALSDKTSYPYLARMNPPAQYQNQALLQLMQKYDMEQAYVIYSSDDYGTSGFNNLISQSLLSNVTFVSSQIVGGTKNYTNTLIPTIQSAIDTYHIRVFVLYVQPNDATIIMQQLSAAGIAGNTTINSFIAMYATVLPFTTSAATYNLQKMPWFNGVVGLCARGPVPGTLYDKLEAGWLAANTTLFVGTRPSLGPSWYNADVVYAFAYALQEVLDTGLPYSSINGTHIMPRIVASNFTGVTGPVFFDKNYDRLGDFVWYNFQPNATFSPAEISAYYSPALKESFFEVNGEPLVFNGMLEPPDGTCHCSHGSCDELDNCTCLQGWSGEECDIDISAFEKGGNSFGTNDIIGVVVGAVGLMVVVVIVAMLFVRYKRRRMIKDLSDKQRSLIKREDIAMHDRLGRGAAGEVFRGMFRGTEVAVKKIIAASTSAAVVEQFETETAIMTSLRHPNIVLFMGVCLVLEKNEMLLVMELMDKGSLHDIIHNNKIKLPFSLCLHIAYQAAKGMNFLHQSDPPIIHCDLKSHNILMDDKWNAKISDFGITRFKSINSKKSDNEQRPSSLGTIYWTAPEVFGGKGHTEASDVYSFGIVLWEVFHRETPYGGKEPMLVVMEVQSGVRPGLKADLDPAIRELITDCWAENPASRPKFDDVMNRLRVLNTQAPLSSYGLHESTYGDAPTGLVYMAATEVINANEMWDKSPMPMYQAMVLHNNLIRSAIDSHNGFEADFSKNRFFIVFRSLKEVINWSIKAQTSINNSKWPEGLHSGNGQSVLRVRIVVNMGVPNCQTDHAGKTTYSGAVVDRTKKILNTTSAKPILVSHAVMEQINSKAGQFSEELSSSPYGDVMDSTRSTGSNKSNDGEKVYEIVPKSMTNNSLQRPTSSGYGMPNAVVVDVEEEWELPHTVSSSRAISWDISSADMREKESAGKGAIGDYTRTIWKDREVVQKVLLNQQLSEEDLLMLTARASVLTKLTHKNLLDFYGVCLEPGHVSLVLGYLPRAGLNSLLTDSSFSLSQPSKVKLVKQIAEAMDYLSSQRDHPWLGIHGNLKSCNVLVQRDSLTVKLCDYGQGNLKDLARTMTSVGTVAWTAPELLNGDEPTPKIAVYSFGVIMWEIYTRAFPYLNEHPIKIVTKIVAGYRPVIPADCPAPYRDLMARCWATEPDQRPSWNEIVSTLSTM